MDILSLNPLVYFITIIVALYIILFFYVGGSAKTKGRSVFYWVILSLFLTPLLSIPLLYFIGETEEKRNERIFKDEELRILARKQNSIEETI